MWKGSESDGTRRPDLMKVSVYSCASLTQKTTRILVKRLPSCAQTSPSQGTRRARGGQANKQGCKFLGLTREDFCARCKGKRGCKRPRAEAAIPVPPAGPPTAPSLMPREKKAVDRYSDDRRYKTRVRARACVLVCVRARACVCACASVRASGRA